MSDVSETAGPTGGSDDECDNCGAMLPPADAAGLRTCLYCGHTTDITPPEVEPEPALEPTVVATSVVVTGADLDEALGRAGRGAKVGKGCALWGILAFVLLMFLVPIGAVMLAEDAFDGIGDLGDLGGEDGIDLDVSGEDALLLPSEPTEPLDVVALTYHYDRDLEESVHEVARFDGDDQPMWRGPRLSESQYQVPLLSDGTRLFTVDDDEVQALSLADGTEQWRGSLTDELTWTCEHCFSLVGDRLLATSSDGVLQAYDTATGKQAWSRRFDDVRAPTHVVGDRVLVIDGTGGDHRGIVLSPADGSELGTVEGSCRRPDGSGSSSDLDPDAQVLPMADGTVLLGYGTWPGCWERRDLATGQVLWQAVLDEVSFSWDLVTVHDQATLVMQDNDEGLLVVDLATGAVRRRPPETDTQLFPLAITSTAHVALSQSTRGSQPWSVVALDPATGAQRWSWSLGERTPAVGTFGASTIVSSNEQQVAIHADDGGVDLVTVDGETGDLTVERIDMATGSAGPERLVDQPEVSGSLRFVPLGWRGRQAALLVGDGIVALDLDTATVQNRYGGG